METGRGLLGQRADRAREVGVLRDRGGAVLFLLSSCVAPAQLFEEEAAENVGPLSHGIGHALQDQVPAHTPASLTLQHTEPGWARPGH